MLVLSAYSTVKYIFEFDKDINHVSDKVPKGRSLSYPTCDMANIRKHLHK